MPVEFPYRPPCRVPSGYEWAPGLRLTDATSAGVGRSRISGQTDSNNVDRRREDGVQLIARAVPVAARNPVPPDQRLLGGRFIAGTPILLLTTTGRRTGKRRTPPGLRPRGGSRCAVRLQRRPPHPARLVPPPTGDQPGPDPSGRRASFCHRQDPDPSRARPAVPRFVEMYKGYAGQEDKTGRQIPLVLLTPDRPNA